MDFDIGIATTMLELSRLAYRTESAATAGIDALALGDAAFFSGGGTQALACGDDTRRFVAFRGTEEDPRDWITDSRFGPRPGELGGSVHSGFHDALDLVWPDVTADIAGAATRQVWVTGHSLGAALAVLAAARMVEAGRKPAGVMTFGQPRTGKSDFRSAYDAELLEVTFRVVNHIDLVTRVPLLVQGYRHVGRMVYIDGDGRIHEDASPWHVARDDVRFRLTHFGRIESAGLGPHLIDAYRMRLAR